MELAVSIIEERNVIDDHLLDIIGNEFKFSHEKGLPEWIKNSVDAYIRREPPVPDDEQHIMLNFKDGKGEPPSDTYSMAKMTVISSWSKRADTGLVIFTRPKMDSMMPLMRRNGWWKHGTGCSAKSLDLTARNQRGSNCQQ